MGKGKSKKLGLGILGLILILFGIGWYLLSLENINALITIIRGALGIVVIIAGIVVILLAKD